jgi:hypothetical protein
MLRLTRRSRDRFAHLKRMEFAKAHDELLDKHGLSSMCDTRSEDVVVVGYPKSGNTWFQMLCIGSVYGVDLECCPISVSQLLMPDASAGGFFRRFTTPMLFKSHELPRPDYRRVVYLVRDGRDAMVSYRHYREAIDGIGYDFTTFVDQKTPLYPSHWSHHVEAWAANPFNAEMMTIRYEDLLLEPVGQLKRFCEFMGIQRSEQLLERAVTNAGFDNLRSREKSEGFWDPAFKSEKQFFRRGQQGSYIDEMPSEALEKFLEHAEPTLRKHGYLVE